jgi:DNA-binding NarL/FixJ family response regulator
LLAVVGHVNPDLAVIAGDVEGGAASACRALTGEGSRTKVLVLGEGADDQTLLDAVEAGAHGFVTADSSVPELIETVRRLNVGEAVVPPAMLSNLLRGLIGRHREEDAVLERFARLSLRERSVLALLVEGMDHDAIGAAMVVSPHTARTHIQNVLKKLGVH